MKIGIQLYTVRDHLNTEKETRQTLTRLKEIGYEGVQPCELGELSSEAYAKILREIGLVCFSFHAGLHDLVNEHGEMVKRIKRLNVIS